MQPVKIFEEADGRDLAVSGTDTYYSKTFGSESDVWSLFITHGAITGTFTCWATNHPKPNLANDTDWLQITLPVPGLTNPTGTGKTGIEVGLSGFLVYRLKYVNASGSGTLAGWYHGKHGRR